MDDKLDLKEKLSKNRWVYTIQYTLMNEKKKNHLNWILSVEWKNLNKYYYFLIHLKEYINVPYPLGVRPILKKMRVWPIPEKVGYVPSLKKLGAWPIPEKGDTSHSLKIWGVRPIPKKLGSTSHSWKSWGVHPIPKKVGGRVHPWKSGGGFSHPWKIWGYVPDILKNVGHINERRTNLLFTRKHAFLLNIKERKLMPRGQFQIVEPVNLY